MRTASILFAAVLALATVCNVQTHVGSQHGSAGEHSESLPLSREAAFQHAVEAYEAYALTFDWRVRVTIDRRLSREAGGLSASRLAELLHANPHSLAVATAVAVCVGDAADSDDTQQTVRLFTELLGSRYERVRYRASESLAQRLAEGTLSEAGREHLLPVVAAAIAKEKAETNRNSLEHAGAFFADPVPIELPK